MFTEALIREFQRNKPPVNDYDEVETLYLGGGTPSMLSGSQLEQILEAISREIHFAEDIEITLEANPGEVDYDRLAAYRSLGVNRVSFGIQSFDNAQLERLGRWHRAHQNIPSVEMAREAGFNNINVDLIFHLPEQSLDNFLRDLRKMLELETEHISIYSLTVEQGTPLFRYVEDGRIEMTSDQLDAEMYMILCEKMHDAGFEHYEVSNFGKPGYHSRHNSNYWNGRHYYSYGPSAHSYNGEYRWWNVRDLSKYLTLVRNNGSPIEDREYLDPETRKNEYLLTRLRTNHGIRFAEWESLFNEPFPESLRSYFRGLIDQYPGWIDEHTDGISLTETGWLFTDSIVDGGITHLEAA